ncbi:alpha/beta hydrolase [Hylemonella gracilis str. Niagara R]|uniref:Alpha/beta hydrolase n=1 Tax=Hylemonella gracilis str. Niagara R TaxID=1458275 RepID=A0A016XIW8_9BURK|nr:alpha/beta fold hydrolase [Hylemonella gracilis]EYC52024.1 alpha/beta hydrolase [Hylemonella gracilis str. Niagara R]
MKHRRLWLIPLLTLLTALGLLAGCGTLDEKQRGWIFQPSDRSWWGGESAAEGMSEVWIDFMAREHDGDAGTSQAARLHGLWLAHPDLTRRNLGPDQAPVLLYLHGARYNVVGSALRARRMQELGFSVLAIDYRGFGKSTAGLPSEASAYEDARAAWDWLARQYPDRPRYIFGHSLGGAIAIELAAQVADERGTLVEGTFTSIPDVVSSYKWGWLLFWPLDRALITQKLEAVKRVDQIGSPLLVVHGSADRTIAPTLGRRLFEAATGPKRFELVEGGTHHNTNSVGQDQYRLALAELFGLRTALDTLGALNQVR